MEKVEAVRAGGSGGVRAGDRRGSLRSELYWRGPGEDRFGAFAIGVLRIDRDAVAEIALFQQPELFGPFALPPSL